MKLTFIKCSKLVEPELTGIKFVYEFRTDSSETLSVECISKRLENYLLFVNPNHHSKEDEIILSKKIFSSLIEYLRGNKDYLKYILSQATLKNITLIENKDIKLSDKITEYERYELQL